MITFWTKRIMVFSLLLFLLSFFLPMAILVNFPSATIFSLRIHSILTTQFVHPDVMFLLFSLFAFVWRSSEEEMNLGTNIFIWDFFTKNALVQLVYTVALTGASFIAGPMIGLMPSFGLWNITMMYIAQGSFKFPDHPVQLFCFPIKIKHVFYPPILMLIFLMLFQSLKIDMIMAYVLAYIEFKYFECAFYVYPLKWVNYCASCWLCRKLGVQSIESQYSTQSNHSIQTLNSSTTADNSNYAFSGRGITIGETKDEEVPPKENDENEFPGHEEEESNIDINKPNLYASLIDENKPIN